LIDIEELERDLSPFADPATGLELLVGEELVRVEMIRDGVPLIISIERANGAVHLHAEDRVDGRQRQFINIRSLLASDWFASIKSMVENQRRMLAGLSLASFIRPEGELDGQPLSQEAFDEATTLGKGGSSSAPLSLMLIDGPAGVGKTSLISRLVAKRAEVYGRDSSLPPVLHVANRGRRLVSLDELIALSIQLVRAKFTYDQVPALIRYGVIQIAIDGFDELVDADGYADAWAVLREFLNDIGAGGPLLLAGRDTFFDLTGFREKLGELGPKVAISHTSLASISPRAARDWLRANGWSEVDLASEDASELLKENSYVLRPYFLSEMAQLQGLQPLLDELVEPREYLVRRFVAREAALIVQKIQLSETVAAELLWELFELIAMEMADAETEAVDLPFIQLAVEVTFSKVLKDPSDLAKLRHKAGSFVFMEHDPRPGFRRFPHTEVSNHFLGSALLKQLCGGEVPRFMRRGYLGTDLLRVIGEQLLDRPIGEVRDLHRHLLELTRGDMGYERLAENACSLLIGSLVVEAPTAGFELARTQAGDVVLFGSIAPATLRETRFARLDCRGADLRRLNFDRCEAAILVVDRNTVLGETCVFPSCLMVERNATVDVEYDPAKILEWINEHRKRERDQVQNKEAVDLLERVCRVFLRQFYIKVDEGDHAGRYLTSDGWPVIEEVLNRFGRVRRTDRKDASGRPGEFVHIVNPQALLSRENPEDLEIWNQVGRLG